MATYSQPNLTIKSWAEEDRPREKLLVKGKQSLSDAELLAILLGSGSRDETAVGLAQRILQSVDQDLNELGRRSIADLTKFKGMGAAKSITIVAAMELGRRRPDLRGGLRSFSLGTHVVYYRITAGQVQVDHGGRGAQRDRARDVPRRRS